MHILSHEVSCGVARSDHLPDEKGGPEGGGEGEELPTTEPCQPPLGLICALASSHFDSRIYVSPPCSGQNGLL